MNERILVIVVHFLGVISLVLVSGICILAILGREIPSVLAAAIGVALGALVGILTPTRTGF
jgi:hypothetical protein